MSARPEPRRSALAGTNPVTNTTDTGAGAAAGASPDRPETAPDAPKSVRQAKVSFYQHPADTDRMRGALLHTMALEGPRTMSAFINNAVATEIRRLENLYNGGQPFPPIPARTLPQGRPLGQTTSQDRES